MSSILSSGCLPEAFPQPSVAFGRDRVNTSLPSCTATSLTPSNEVKFARSSRAWKVASCIRRGKRIPRTGKYSTRKGSRLRRSNGCCANPTTAIPRWTATAMTTSLRACLDEIKRDLSSGVLRVPSLPSLRTGLPLCPLGHRCTTTRRGWTAVVHWKDTRCRLPTSVACNGIIVVHSRKTAARQSPWYATGFCRPPKASFC